MKERIRFNVPVEHHYSSSELSLESLSFSILADSEAPDAAAGRLWVSSGSSTTEPSFNTADGCTNSLSFQMFYGRHKRSLIEEALRRTQGNAAHKNSLIRALDARWVQCTSN
jgi:hypothetical protein